MRDLFPLPIFAADKVLDLAAVAVENSGENRMSVGGSGQSCLCDAWEVFADLVTIFAQRRSELVEPDLLIKIHVRPRPLAFVRIARVVETGSVGVPGDAAAGGAAVDARNHIAGFFAASDVEDVDVSRLTPAARKRNRDEPAIERRHEKIHRCFSVGARGYGIEHYAFGVLVVDRIERDQERLLFRRLKLQREEASAAKNKRAIGWRPVRQQLAKALRDRRATRNCVENRSRVFPLFVDPFDDCRIVGILEPSVVIDNLHVVVSVGHWDALRCRRMGERGRKHQEENLSHAR